MTHQFETDPASINNWFSQRHRRAGARHRLFLFPFAGGAAGTYAGLAEALPDWIEPWPIELPGRAARLREAPYDKIDPLIEALMPAIRPLLNIEFSIFGYSMGARIALRFLQKLELHGMHRPSTLFVAAHRWPWTAPDADAKIREEFTSLQSESFWERIHNYGGTPPEIMAHQELRELLEPMLRADFAMAYEPLEQEESLLSVPIVAFSGSKDPYATIDQVNDWKLGTTGPFKHHQFNDGHFFLSNHGKEMARLISKQISGLYPS